jgi:hypothetical protein
MQLHGCQQQLQLARPAAHAPALVANRSAKRLSRLSLSSVVVKYKSYDEAGPSTSEVTAEDTYRCGACCCNTAYAARTALCPCSMHLPENREIIKYLALRHWTRVCCTFTDHGSWQAVQLLRCTCCIPTCVCPCRAAVLNMPEGAWAGRWERWAPPVDGLPGSASVADEIRGWQLLTSGKSCTEDKTFSQILMHCMN